MMETSIVDFHKRFYIPAMQKLLFHLSHVNIIVTRHCGNTLQEAFKFRADYLDVFCRLYFVEPCSSQF